MEIVGVLETILLRVISSMTKEQIMRFLVQVTIQDIRRERRGLYKYTKMA